jgi:cellulose synthase/poly-beta-1,6-N-acetylglucosamine synthase-like glycosyltransferase
MLTEWIRWISAFRPSELAGLLAGLLFLDGTRYAFSGLALLVVDMAHWSWRALRPRAEPPAFRPSVCALLVGYNEASTIARTLGSVWGTYPGLEIVVVDDGSTDGMADVARGFARTHAGVTVVRRERRGGKSSGMNFGLCLTQAEVVVAIDCDSFLGNDAIERMVQPLRDPRVGAVSGTVIVRSPRKKLIVRLQAYEYLRSIFIGRVLSERLGILGIVSGAFGAFRREALMRTQGWDVGPPEDLDLVLAIRKCGYRIATAQYAYCLTKTPEQWGRLIKQRMRWDESGVIRNHCRKHLDMAQPFAANFRLANLALFLESWTTNLFTLAGMWIWLAVMAWTRLGELANIAVLLYLGYTACEVLNALVILVYSEHRRRDFLTCLVVPLSPLYQGVLSVQRTLSMLREGLWRTSFRDNFVPEHVRDVTWHW